MEALIISSIAAAIKKGDHRATKTFHDMMTEDERTSQPFKHNEMTIKLVRADGKEPDVPGKIK